MKPTIRSRERKHGARGRPGKVYLVDWTDKSGKRHQEVVRDARGHSTKELAEKRLEQIIGEKKHGLVAPHERRTFKELREAWLASVKSEGDVIAETLADYQRAVESRLAPALDLEKVDDIRARTVRDLRTKLRADGFAPATIKKDMGLLHQIMAMAVVDDEIAANPCAAGRKRKRKKASHDIDAETGEVTETAQRALSRDEVAALLQASRELAESANDWANETISREVARLRYTHSHWCYHALLTVAARTGLRRSELFGLWWEDVDLQAGTVRVRRRLRDGRYGPPKSTQSRRAVPLTADAVATLRVWRMRTPFKAPRANVFATVFGKPLTGSNVARRGVVPAVAKAKLGKVGLHTLRHTYGSQLLAAGEDIATVSKLMGHASVTVTTDVYMHAVKKPLQETTQKLEAYLAAK